MIFFPTHYVTDDGGWDIRKLANTTHGDSSFPMPNVHFETASEEEEEEDYSDQISDPRRPALKTLEIAGVRPPYKSQPLNTQ